MYQSAELSPTHECCEAEAPTRRARPASVESPLYRCTVRLQRADETKRPAVWRYSSPTSPVTAVREQQRSDSFGQGLAVCFLRVGRNQTGEASR